MSAKPRTIEVLALLPRGPRSRLTVMLDEGANGTRFVSVKRWVFTKSGWISPRGIALQLHELRAVAIALARSAGPVNDEAAS